MPIFKNNQKGVSLYLAFLVMTVLMGIAFGLSTTLISQTKMLREMGYSVVAFYAADTGVEKVLVDRQNPNSDLDHYSGSLANGAAYQVQVTSGGAGSCADSNYFCIKSIGGYQGVKRAIEVSY